ncbi:hypothetical protein [Sphaerisporangium sp. TRM90804]|uniref:hypothetical protein n=1 Tax=Sphaerisporangium sp. TRM90804 TaxID=3031113 RepID=UPI0024480184|nr:hypothetical protein [Sphaerisporangium sp. TRM90804]MDH2424477.1 hypothetical protein [Sphaerisporangium sp. TRM90804]
MAPTPETFQKVGAPWSPVPLEGIAESLGGAVHLAYARRPASGVVTVAAGFTAEAARTRAEVRASAVDALHLIADGGTQLRPLGGARELYLADFMPEPPDDTGGRVSGVGLLSGDRYLLPAEVVWTGERDSRVEPTLVGLVDGRPDGASGGIADLLAHDVVTRWWSHPRMPLLRVSAHLARLLPDGVVPEVTLLGLRVAAFVLPGPGFPIAVVGVSGDGTTIATAAARSAGAAVGEAFLRAIAARAQPWTTLPTADSLRRLTVWHRESDYLAHLERSAVDAEPSAVEEPARWEWTPSWADIACRRFGHEPVLVAAGAADEPVKVVCPGAAVYRTILPGTTLPCPVP